MRGGVQGANGIANVAGLLTAVMPGPNAGATIATGLLPSDMGASVNNRGGVSICIASRPGHHRLWDRSIVDRGE